MNARLGPDAATVHKACLAEGCAMHRLCTLPGSEGPDPLLVDWVVRRRRVLGRGETLFRPGDSADTLVAVRSGSIKTFLCTGDGRVQVTGFHFAGDVLGLAALDAARHCCGAEALEPSAVCEVSARRLCDAAREFPDLYRQLVGLLRLEMQRSEQLLLMLGRRTAEEKLASCLISLWSRLTGGDPARGDFTLSMSRSDLGNHLGIAEETVCRVLGRFEQQGLLAMRRRHMTLLDPARLQQVAEGLVPAAPQASGDTVVAS